MAALEIPTGVGFNSKEFRLVTKQQITPVAGFIQTANRTNPFWIAQYTTNPLRDTQYDAAIAFLDQLQGSMNTFLAYDPRRPMPRAYQTQTVASDPWTQSGQPNPKLVSSDYTASTLSLSAVAAGAVFTSGDYISFQYNNIWYLFRIAVTAVAGGTTITLSVNPPPPTIAATANLVIRYRKACAEMKMIGNYKETDSVDGKPVLSWNAAQFLNVAV